MGDIALIGGPFGEYVADLGIVDDDLARDEGLVTAMFLSLALDRRANDDDALPVDDDDRRGWLGDEFALVEGDRIGSRLWLLDRTARRADLVRDAELYAGEALDWLRADSVLERLDIAAELSLVGLLINIDAYRPDGRSVEFRYPHVWEGQANAV